RSRCEIERIKIPPAEAIRHEHDLATVGRAFRLEDRFRRSAGDWFGPADCAICSDLAEVEPRAVPRHVGMIPGEPAEPPSIRREPRRRMKILPPRENVYGPPAIAEIDGDDGIYRLPVDGLILAHADPAVTAPID